MLTNNYKKICAAMITSVARSEYAGGAWDGGYYNSSYTVYPIPFDGSYESELYLHVPVVNTLGNTVDFVGDYACGFPGVGLDFRGTSYGSCILVGEDGTQPSPNDYSMKDQKDQVRYHMRIGNITYARGMDNDYAYIEMIIPITNDNQESITVREIGYCQECRCRYQGALFDYMILLDRTVLETPVTIAAGATKSVKYTIKTATAFSGSGG